MAHRYFTQNIQGDTAYITGPDAAHLAKVLRAKPGMALTLCDGNGFDYATTVASASPGEVALHIQGKTPTKAEPALWADVFLGYAKGDKMDWAVQKLVELGAAAIYPFYSQNTVVNPQEWGEKKQAERTARLCRIAHEAAKQSGRGRLPTVYPPLPFAKVVQLAAGRQKALFLYEKGGISLQTALAGQPQSIALITGAEGGFTPAEAAAAHTAGCTAVGLGPRILRCETAPVAALSAAMALTGNLE